MEHVVRLRNGAAHKVAIVPPRGHCREGRSRPFDRQAPAFTSGSVLRRLSRASPVHRAFVPGFSPKRSRRKMAKAANGKPRERGSGEHGNSLVRPGVNAGPRHEKGPSMALLNVTETSSARKNCRTHPTGPWRPTHPRRPAALNRRAEGGSFQGPRYRISDCRQIPRAPLVSRRGEWQRRSHS